MKPDTLELTQNIFDQMESKINRNLSTDDGVSRPFVTLSYAQSLDGSISLDSSCPVCLSNNQTQILTHRLRAGHDAILIGIGTLIADNPLLTVRHVNGSNPQPVVVDSKIRFPVNARLMKDNPCKPWIASTVAAGREKEQQIATAGGRVLRLPAMDNGWVNLPKLMEILYDMGIRKLMVEGGAKIITSFLKDQIADQIVLTLAPVVLGGLKGVGKYEILHPHMFEVLNNVQFYSVENDLVVRADLLWENK